MILSKTFLHAEWRKLVMANYVVDADLLIPFLPRKTELDLWNDCCYLSLVGFVFKNTRLWGFRIPFHSDFEEVNLRFYVRYKDGKWKRGVVFIKEFVPRAALTLVANYFYHENYETRPMDSSWTTADDQILVEYRWKKSTGNSLKVTAGFPSEIIHEGSVEEFITEHYWGYSKISNEITSEYRVEHPRWEVYPVKDFQIEVDFADLYGPQFGFLSTEKPASVLLAEGSEIRVMGGRRI